MAIHVTYDRVSCRSRWGLVQMTRSAVPDSIGEPCVPFRNSILECYMVSAYCTNPVMMPLHWGLHWSGPCFIPEDAATEKVAKGHFFVRLLV
eukprot:scaffold45850_cov46-Attheya_sp.AAC.2